MKNIKKSIMVAVAATVLVTTQNSHAMLNIASQFVRKIPKGFTIKPGNTLRLPYLNLSSKPVSDSSKEFTAPGAQVSSSAWKTYANNLIEKLTGKQKTTNDLETRGAADKSKNGSQEATQDAQNLSSYVTYKIEMAKKWWALVAGLSLAGAAVACENEQDTQNFANQPLIDENKTATTEIPLELQVVSEDGIPLRVDIILAKFAFNSAATISTYGSLTTPIDRAISNPGSSALFRHLYIIMKEALVNLAKDKNLLFQAENEIEALCRQKLSVNYNKYLEDAIIGAVLELGAKKGLKKNLIPQTIPDIAKELFGFNEDDLLISNIAKYRGLHEVPPTIWKDNELFFDPSGYRKSVHLAVIMAGLAEKSINERLDERKAKESWSNYFKSFLPGSK